MAHNRQHKNENPSLPIVQLKGIATQLYQHFHRADNIPADEIYVPVDLIRTDTEAENSFFATVRFITTYVERKVHNIRIGFQLDVGGRANLQSIKYI